MKNLILILSCLLLAVSCYAEIIIVDDDWPYDFNNIQTAIAYSRPEIEGICEMAKLNLSRFSTRDVFFLRANFACLT